MSTRGKEGTAAGSIDSETQLARKVPVDRINDDGKVRLRNRLDNNALKYAACFCVPDSRPHPDLTLSAVGAKMASCRLT
jgi:hypothetical protein